MNALDVILNKPLEEVSDLEHAIIFLWREETGNERIARQAAAELADYQARLSAAESLLLSYEWIRDGECPECHNDVTDGHKAGCTLDEFLNPKAEV